MDAGTDTFKTQPDGLWIFISVAGGFADCVAIEACSTATNLADKRSRYAPSTTSLVLDCPKVWLTHNVQRGKGVKPRWELTDGIQSEPLNGIQLPVRFLRVLYFLKADVYKKWRRSGVPASHEFVAGYSSINSYTSQMMQHFLRRMTPDHHWYTGK